MAFQPEGIGDNTRDLRINFRLTAGDQARDTAATRDSHNPREIDAATKRSTNQCQLARTLERRRRFVPLMFEV